MKTKIVSIMAIACFFCVNEEKAQVTFTGGLTAGVSYSSIKVSSSNSTFTDAVNGKNIMGFEGGLFARINFDPLFVKPMLMAAYMGGTSDFVYKDGTVKSAKFAVGKIEVPLLLGLRLIGPLRIEAGPVYNWIYTENHGTDSEIKVSPSGLGYRFGVNIEFAIINIGVGYQGITNKSTGSTTSTFKTPDELILSLGIRLGGSAH